MARLAAIDIGSNAMRLRIVEALAPESKSPDEAWVFHEVSSVRAPVRLGTDVFSTGRLSKITLTQACQALRDFRLAMDAAQVDAYRAVATSAVRDAKNGAALVERARRESGIELEVIEGVEEARLIQLAIQERLGPADKRMLLVDVGGGSTEFTLLEGGVTVAAVSLPLGTVRLLEAYLPKDASAVPTAKERNLLDETIERGLLELRKVAGGAAQLKGATLVGTGGNVESLAQLCKSGEGRRAIDAAMLGALCTELLKKSASDRARDYQLRPDRADTIVPAARIFMLTAKACSAAEVLAPGVGLKEGLLLDLVAKNFSPRENRDPHGDGLVESCVRLGLRFAFDESHGRRVAQFCQIIIDALIPHYAFGPRDPLLLRAAGILHDIGDYVRYDSHHKHSHYLIENSDLIGFSQEERTVVANIARYHRKSLPDLTHANFAELSKPNRDRVRKLAAILRIADALDREHLGKVESLRARLIGPVSARELELTLGGAERDLEEWTAHAKSDLLRDVFNLRLKLA
jgi:exopolyphosphatase / guanosine-5'-triphosphate,3'-diphosphate pyrophosphatase